MALNHSRPEQPPRDVTLRADGETLYVDLDQASDQPLLSADLEQEALYQRNAGFRLELSR